MATNSQNKRKIQELIAKAQADLDAAKRLADETGESFTFNEQTYYPQTVTPGRWVSNHGEEWQSSGGDNC